MFVLLFAACQASAPPPQLEPGRTRSAPAAASCKPEAPIALELATRPLGSDTLEVTARATPTANVTAIELQLALPPHAQALDPGRARFGATLSGHAVTLTTRIRVDDRTSSITAIARVPIDDVEMARTATLEIGAPAPAPRTRTYALPDGELAREVRP